jgi:dihydropteroate synthase
MHRVEWFGILNLTPDSFSDGGQFETVSSALNQALNLEANGARFIDVGAVSTRPSSLPISAETEWSRICEVLPELRKQLKKTTRISLDTARASIALRASENNWIDAINDVCSGEFCELSNTRIFNLAEKDFAEKSMKSTLSVASHFGLGFVSMHMQNLPTNMQDNPTYESLEEELKFFFAKKLEYLNEASISQKWLDPGIGFGKTFFHNASILAPQNIQTLVRFCNQNYAKLLLGISRKSFVKSIHMSGGGTDQSWKEKCDIESKLWEARCADLGCHSIRSHTVGFSETIQNIRRINDISV